MKKCNLSLNGLTLVMLNSHLNNHIFDTKYVCLPNFYQLYACMYLQAEMKTVLVLISLIVSKSVRKYILNASHIVHAWSCPPPTIYCYGQNVPLWHYPGPKCPWPKCTARNFLGQNVLGRNVLALVAHTTLLEISCRSSNV